MIDMSKVAYRLVLLTEDGKRRDISDYVQDLGWEENERELSARMTFTVIDTETGDGPLQSLVKPGCLAIVLAGAGATEAEVIRGTVTDWKPTSSGSADKLDVTCYDCLYHLQESQDNLYFSAGVSTKAAITRIFHDWGIPLDGYDGPDVAHGKLVYKSESLADAILDILDDAKKKGGGEAFIRSQGGKVVVMRWGSNQEVYHFGEDNAKLASYRMGTGGMVTRVKVVGKEDKEGRSSVEATVDGLTQYGIRQKIYVREKDTSIEDARKAAKEILKEEGAVQEEMTVQAPDVPAIRKGDRVHLKFGQMEEYYLVKGIRHDAGPASMDLDLKKAEGLIDSTGAAGSTKEGRDVGDVVQFKGGIHHVSPDAGAKGYKVGPGKAKITKRNPAGAHPWHLVYLDWSDTHVYGWVDDGTFE